MRIKPDAASLFWQDLASKNQSPTWQPVKADHVFRAALEQLQGREFPVVAPIRGGVLQSVYVLADTEYLGTPNRSEVVAVPRDLVEALLPGDKVKPPLDLKVTTTSVRCPEGWGVVRLLTPWIDGFMAFAPLPERAHEIRRQEDWEKGVDLA